MAAHRRVDDADLDLLTYDTADLTDDGSGDGSLDEQDLVDAADAAQLTDAADGRERAARGRVSLREAERAERRRAADLRSARRALRRRDGTLQAVDERGVRGAQERDLLTPGQLRQLARDGELDRARVYRREGGFDASKARMTTSWVDNVRFTAALRSNTAPVAFGRVKPRRYVAPSNFPLAAVLLDNGVERGVGAEYAVFSRALDSRAAAIYSAPDLTLSIDLTAVYGRVARDPGSLQLFTLPMSAAHAVLLDNATLGNVVRLQKPVPIEVFKQKRTLADAPVAEVTGPNFRYSFRFDPAPAVRRWRLTFAEWWLKRSHLMGVRDADESVYFRAEIALNGVQLDPTRVHVLWNEDAESNALAPTLELEVYPGSDARTGRLLPLRRDQSIEVRLFASTRIVVTQRGDVARPTGGKTAPRTRWVELPELSFKEANTNDVLRDAVPRRGRVNRTFRRARQPIDSSDAEADSARGLRAVDVEYRLVDDLDEFRRADDLLAIESMRLGPLSLSAVRQAVAEARRSIVVG